MTFRVHKLDSFLKMHFFWVINFLFVLQKTTTMPSASFAYTNKNMAAANCKQKQRIYSLGHQRNKSHSLLLLFNNSFHISDENIA